MKKKKGFTLVELLAVIVILAVILVIAVPKIMDTIQNAKEGTFMSSAKLIANQAEKKYIENQTLGITDKIDCDDIVKTTDDYNSCSIKFDSTGKASVTIIGKDKFEGMAICGGTKTDVEISDDCKTNNACFAYQVVSIADYDVNQTACEEYFSWDIGIASEVGTYCSGGVTSSELSLAQAIQDSIEYNDIYFLEDLVVNEVITNIEGNIGITGYDYDNEDCGTDIVIPDTIDGLTVTHIGEHAFTTEGLDPTPTEMSNNEKKYSIMPLKNSLYNVEVMPIEQEYIGIGITSIKFPNTIEYIGFAAFMDNDEMFSSGVLDFSNLTNLVYIDDHAFENTGINRIILPDNVTYIDNNAFDYNPLESVIIGNSDAQIGCNAFGDMDDVTLPEGLPDWYYSDSCKYCFSCPM